jgi:hypothetical protein
LTWFTLYDANNTWNKQLSNKSLLLLVKSRVETGKVSKEVQQGLEIRGFWFKKKTVQLKTALREVYTYVLK